MKKLEDVSQKKTIWKLHRQELYETERNVFWRLSVLPKSKSHDNRANKIAENVKRDIVTAMGDGACTSQRQAAQMFNVSLGSVNTIIKCRALKHYKYKEVQELKQEDYPKRLEFCRVTISHGKQWIKRIIFSDEASLHLNGIINTHNRFYYAYENEHRIIEKHMK